MRLLLQPEQVAQRERLLDAAEHIVRDYAAWFGGLRDGRVTLVDLPWRGSRGDRLGDGVATFETRWLVGRASLQPEKAMARAIARLLWSSVVDEHDAELLDELVEYSHGLAVERIYAARFQRPAYSALELRYFGDLLPWTLSRVLLDRAAGLRDIRGRRLLTLERYIGWPALQRALVAVVEQSASHRLSRDDVFGIIGAAAGQDLHWFAAAAFQPNVVFDYAIRDLTTVGATCSGQPCYRTTAVAGRNGAPFTGSSLDAVGPYESGRAVRVAVAFEGGASAVDTWDGRSDAKTFSYESAAPAVSATIDPEDIIALDRRRVNNSRRLGPRPATWMAGWSGRWMVWLQDVFLAYASLV